MAHREHAREQIVRSSAHRTFRSMLLTGLFKTLPAVCLATGLGLVPATLEAMPLPNLSVQAAPGATVDKVWCCRYGHRRFVGYGWRRPIYGYGGPRRYYGWHAHIGERGPRIGSYAR